MREALRAALIAPAPIFVLLLLLLVRPSLGWADALFGTGIALACSYGFMLVAGLPTHLILQRLRWLGWPQYIVGFLLAFGVVVLMLTAVEGSPPAPSPDDNSPFATLTLRGGGWALLFLLFSPFVGSMASMFWQRVVRVEREN